VARCVGYETKRSGCLHRMAAGEKSKIKQGTVIEGNKMGKVSKNSVKKPYKVAGKTRDAERGSGRKIMRS